MHLYRCKVSLLLICATMLIQAGSRAAVTLFDFEKASDIAAWKLRTPAQDRLIQTTEFATSGKYSMQFISPEYRAGMEQFPAFETKPVVQDWREFDRLVIDVANPSPYFNDFWLLVEDQPEIKEPVLSYHIDAPRLGFKRCVVNIKDFPNGVDKSHVSLIHFFSQAPVDMRFCIDSITLLKPEEPLPSLPPNLGRQIASMKSAALDETIKGIEAAKKSVMDRCSDPILRSVTELQMDRIKQKYEKVRSELAEFTGTPEELGRYDKDLESLGKTMDRVRSEAIFKSDYSRLGMPKNGMAIGFAPSTDKILPRDMPFTLKVSKKIEISLARNEKESLQVAVLPESVGLHDVKVSVSDLKNADGSVLSSDRINCDVVGYVQTKSAPPYNVPYVGWWPDPILDFTGPVSIASGDLQTFWVRVRAPKDQKPGLYHGKLTVSAKGVEPAVFEFNVKVRAFTMPDCTPLPTATTFDPPEISEYIRNVICGGAENWKKMRFAYADFLSDYYVDYDSLYRRTEPDFDVLKHKHDKGTLTTFNFGYFSDNIEDNRKRFKPVYEKAKELGILDHAYIYGFDECAADMFPSLEAAAKALKADFPEVPVMTTSYDISYGQDTLVKSMDMWCPLTPSYNTEQADKARKNGKWVWWYICCAPHHPFANWFVEYPGIDIRLLMGAMTAKFRPDGFLYYSLAFWNSNKPITSGPFTNWNPVSWTTYDGDGSIFCCGPGGKPVPTIRLENYRDGLEDFAYVRILEAVVRRFESRESELSGHQKEWLKQAKAALIVPDKLVKSMTVYSLDAKDLYAYRERIADMIEKSGVTDADPWGKDFGPRGFDR